MNLLILFDLRTSHITYSLISRTVGYKEASRAGTVAMTQEHRGLCSCIIATVSVIFAQPFAQCTYVLHIVKHINGNQTYLIRNTKHWSGCSAPTLHKKQIFCFSKNLFKVPLYFKNYLQSEPTFLRKYSRTVSGIQDKNVSPFAVGEKHFYMSPFAQIRRVIRDEASKIGTIYFKISLMKCQQMRFIV